MTKNVFEQIDKLTAEYVDIWEEVCNIESPSSDMAAVDRVGAYFIALAEKRGWKTEIFEQEKFGNVVCVTMNADADAQPIAISGHMDTVHPIGSFGTPAVRRDEQWIYGPGVADCKGGVVAGFLAMDALRICGFKSRPVTMYVQSNEEIGSGLNNKAPIEYICKRAENALAFLNLEDHEGFFDGKVCLIRKGIAGFNFSIKGVAAHSSYCAKEGASAIKEAAYKILELEKLKDDEGITCNCGIISGGSAPNAVPDRCDFRADVRFRTMEQYEKAVEYLQKVADTVYVPGCICTLTQTNLRPAMELNERNVSLLEKVNAIFVESGLSPLEIGMKNGGSDASDVTLHGIPCIDSIGVSGERIHSTEEHALISSLPESAKRVAAIICNLR